MKDTEFLLHAFRGNQSAVEFVLLVARVADVYDNLVDRDAVVLTKDIHDAFWALAIEMPGNAFYRAHMDDLRPVMATGIVNWLTANQMETMDFRAVEIAHVIRYSIADVAILAALLCGGREWAAEVGPELRLRAQRSDLNEYINSLKTKREVNHATE